jgi:hypothetical protein
MMMSSSAITFGIEQLTISTAMNSIMINLLDGKDTITMNDISSLYITSLTIIGGAGDDTYIFVPSILSGLLSLSPSVPSPSSISIVDNIVGINDVNTIQVDFGLVTSSLNGVVSNHTLTGFGLPSTCSLSFTNINQMNISLGRCSPIHVDCLHTVTIPSSLVNTMTTVDMKGGMDHIVTIGDPLVGTTHMFGSVNVFTSVLPQARCVGKVVVDNGYGNHGGDISHTAMSTPLLLRGLFAHHTAFLQSRYICNISLIISSYDDLTINGTDPVSSLTVHSHSSNISVYSIHSNTYIWLYGDNNTVNGPHALSSSSPFANELYAPLYIATSDDQGHNNIYHIKFAGSGSSTISIHDTSISSNLIIRVYHPYQSSQQRL